MKKSLPLHSQIRNEAYNTNKHSADNGSNERQANDLWQELHKTIL